MAWTFSRDCKVTLLMYFLHVLQRQRESERHVAEENKVGGVEGRGEQNQW